MIKRPRRLRKNETIRNLVAETTLNPASLVYPLFVKEGSGIKEEIPSMPGQFRFSIDELLKEVDGYAALGLKSILLFGIPDMKDEMASSAYDDDGIIQRAVRALKARFPELYVITDVCLCEYMSHGHCGVLKDGEVDNDTTLELLAKTALSHASAGADIVMVKPGLAFLDVLRQTAEVSDVPVAVYNVSGEYAMVKAAANLGLIDEDAIVRENLVAFKRAGADIIITYHAKEALEKGLLN